MSELFDRLRSLRRDAPIHEGDAPIHEVDAPIHEVESPSQAGDAPIDKGDAPREAGDAPPATGIGRDLAAPAWLRQRLAGAAPVLTSGATVGPPEGLVLANGARGAFAFREERFEGSHRHGAWALADVDAASRAALALVAKDDTCADFQLRESVFLDVETTGLSGGAGTISFLVALGRFEGQAFHLWQGFLRDPSEEHALLDEVARRIGGSRGIVSFFGKSFDRHRLEDKMRVFRVVAPFEGRPHLDLYWPVQRLYGPGLRDGRLATAERELAGVVRAGDLPGSRAPEAWFDFLAGRGHRLEDVFRHNRDDVLSLVALAAHLGRALCETDPAGGPLAGPAGTRAAGIARLLVRRGEHEEALRWIELALARGAGNARELTLERGELFLRLGRPAPARALFEDLAAGADGHAARALLALAKLHEHDLNDPAGAADACARLRRLSERALTGASYASAVRGLARREARLARKLLRTAE